MKINTEAQAGLFIKVFCSIINNPKIAKLDHQTFRFYIYLHILAKNYGSNGTIKNTMDEICWELRWEKQDAELSMNNLLELGFVSKNPGAYIIKDWSASQYTVAYQRLKRCRSKKPLSDDNGGDNGMITTEKEKELELDGEAEVEGKNPQRRIDITEQDFNSEMEMKEEFIEEDIDRAEEEIEYDDRIAGVSKSF